MTYKMLTVSMVTTSRVNFKIKYRYTCKSFKFFFYNILTFFVILSFILCLRLNFLKINDVFNINLLFSKYKIPQKNV